MVTFQKEESWTTAGGNMSSLVIAKFVGDLKSKSEEIRYRSAKELSNYVSIELREVQQEELNAFLDSFTKQILELVKSEDYSSKLGGILAIVALINADVCNTGDRISRLERN